MCWRQRLSASTVYIVSSNSRHVSPQGASPVAGKAPGRPRDDARRLRILAAAADLAAADPARVTLEQIASAASVSRTTLYKWWDGPHEVLLDALLERTSWSLDHGEGTALQRLEGQLLDLVSIMTDGRTEGTIRTLAAGAAADPDARQRFFSRWLAPRRAVAAQIIRDGIAAGELRDDVDSEAAIDALFGPLYERAFFTGQPLDRDVVQSIVRLVGDGLRRRPQ